LYLSIYFKGITLFKPGQFAQGCWTWFFICVILCFLGMLIFYQLPLELYMKYVAVLCLFTLVACRYERNETITRLLTDQKRLKDSANNINERIGRYLQKGMYDSAEMQKIQLGAVYTRLKEIQSAIDDRSK